MQAFTVIGVPPCPGGRTWERGLLIGDRGPKGQGSLRPLAGLGLAAHCALGLACLPYPPLWGIVFRLVSPLACGNWLVGLARAPLSLSPLLRRSYLVARDRVWRWLPFHFGLGHGGPMGSARFCSCCLARLAAIARSFASIPIGFAWDWVPCRQLEGCDEALICLQRRAKRL